MDRTTLSFSEAEGISEFPAVLKWGEVDKRIRSRLWSVIFGYIDSEYESLSQYDEIYGDFRSFMTYYLLEFDYMMRDDIVDLIHKSEIKIFLRKYFDESNYVKIFEFAQSLLRYPAFGEKFRKSFERALNVPYSPYRVIGNPPTIMPVLSEEQGKLLKDDLSHLNSTSFESAKNHTAKAIDALNRGDHSGCVREAITSVEAAAREFTGDINATLSSALRKLTQDGHSHPALNNAFAKLYAYTSDEKGIRHSEVFGQSATVDFEESIFFLSTCVAFVGYLARKKTKST